MALPAVLANRPATIVLIALGIGGLGAGLGLPAGIALWTMLAFGVLGVVRGRWRSRDEGDPLHPLGKMYPWPDARAQV